MTFKQVVSLEEKVRANRSLGHPVWVKGTSVYLASKVRSLSKKIASTDDTNKKLELIANQNKLIAYLQTLGIAINIKDNSLMRRFGRSS